MLDDLSLHNFSTTWSLPLDAPKDLFVLRTCQRTLVLSYGNSLETHLGLEEGETHRGEEAYLYLLEMICGLKSRLVGESEIVGQFKSAYQEYLKKEKSPQLLRILEKILMDAKKVRTEYLIGLSQKTYASISRKFLLGSKAKEVVILGSGEMAEDLINQLKKKSEIIICARNQKRVQELCAQHELKVIPWEQKETLSQFPHVANTIGTDEIIFDQSFFTRWSQQHPERQFVDLGSPSCIDTPLGSDQGVIRIEQIFDAGAIHENHKWQQIQKAKEKLTELTKRRTLLLKEHEMRRQLRQEQVLA